MALTFDGDTTQVTITPERRSSIVVSKPSDITVEVLEKGSRGEKGEKGDAGAGFPAGGTTGQYMIKVSDADYDATWTSVTGSGLFNVIEDSTPQLGGNLDIRSSSLFTSVTDGDITITPNGTGRVNLDGTIKFKRFSSSPSAFEGGMYADDQDNLFLGVSDS